jgi:hypothetical protein
MFEVLHTHPIVQDFPLHISCLDHLQQKIFIGTTDGSILDYSIEEDPFSITLLQVHKNVRKNINQILILPRSRQIAIISNGSIFMGDYTSTMTMVQIEKIRDVRSIARSKFEEQHFDTLAIGTKRGIVIYQITPYEMIEGTTIRLPSTPVTLQFISKNAVLFSAQRGVYLVDISDSKCQKIFSINDPLFQKSIYLVSVVFHPFSRSFFYNLDNKLVS